MELITRNFINHYVFKSVTISDVVINKSIIVHTKDYLNINKGKGAYFISVASITNDLLNGRRIRSILRTIENKMVI